MSMPAERPIEACEPMTIAMANAMLPLVRRIVADIVEIAETVQWRKARVADLSQGDGGLDPEGVYGEEELAIAEAYSQDALRLDSLVVELERLGLVLADAQRGIVHFPVLLEVGERAPGSEAAAGGEATAVNDSESAARDAAEMVWFCWQPGDLDIGLWHRDGASCLTRRGLALSTEA